MTVGITYETARLCHGQQDRGQRRAHGTEHRKDAYTGKDSVIQGPVRKRTNYVLQYGDVKRSNIALIRWVP